MSSRTKKPQQRAREARRAAFDLYLPRLLRGDLTRAEAALLAEYIQEEVRVSDDTHVNLKATSRALDLNRAATDSAIQEAEERAREAEERAAALEAKPQYALSFDASAGGDPLAGTLVEKPAVILHTTREPASEAEELRRRDTLRRRALAETFGVSEDTPWPTLLTCAAVAHQLAKKITESEEVKARFRQQLAEAKEQARVATVAALRMRSQTPTSALRTLDAIRSATSIAEACTHLGIYYGMAPETAGTMARRWRTAAEQAAENRAGKAEAALAELHRDTVRVVAAWKSARARARKKEAQRKTAVAQAEQAAQQAQRQAAELEETRRAKVLLAQWEDTYGKQSLRDTRVRLKTAEGAIQRVLTLHAEAQQAGAGAPNWGPTWEALWETLGDALTDPQRMRAARRCMPLEAAPGHPVEALLSALKEGERPMEAQRLVRAFYDAIHDACCPLDHGEARAVSAHAAIRQALTPVLPLSVIVGAQR